MVIKDKAYEQHLKDLELDRPKEFDVPRVTNTEEYVREWCAKNGLKHETAKRRRRKRAGPLKAR